MSRQVLETIPVRLSERSYAIEVGWGLLPAVGERVAELTRGRTALVVSDANVAPTHAARVARGLAAAGFQTEEASVPPGESTKTLRHAAQLYDRLVDRSADRGTVVVAVGGGVVGDLAGFVAATYARGIPFVQVPTTLLAMVDASVGGKVGVDHPGAKNMIGAFHQPSAVFCDMETLDTLPAREYRAGLAEVIKHGMILDADFFAYLEANVAGINQRARDVVARLVARSCQLKAGVVERDERETTGLRAVLNYGHTFAHALETAGGYGGLLHGEAVSIGMTAAAHLAVRMGRIDRELARRQIALCAAVGLPTQVPEPLRGRDLFEIMKRDKKSKGGVPRFVLPTRLGHAETVGDVPADWVRAALVAASQAEGPPTGPPTDTPTARAEAARREARLA